LFNRDPKGSAFGAASNALPFGSRLNEITKSQISKSQISKSQIPNLKMSPPRVIILRAPGTNCDHETAFAFEKAGGSARRTHINELLANPGLTRDSQILCIPGGFSYGDDIAAGRILGNQIRHHLGDVLQEFKAAGKLVLGICNGFQVLMRSGLLLPDDDQGEPATLTWNDSTRYQDLWVHLGANAGSCVFLRGVERMYLPVAHAEGKFVPRDQSQLEKLREHQQVVLQYINPEMGKATDSQLPFPANPNGSIANIAGVTDETGRVLGLMPHPERHLERTHHPRWTRGEGRDPGDGFVVFRNAVQYFS
jgi:phosphoribosylformylglycinamidine synthase I